MVIVEPWAQEFRVDPNSTCHIVALNPHTTPTFETELYQGVLIVSVCEGESTYEFWRAGMLEFSCTIPIPW